MQLPETEPREDPVSLWALQVELLSKAEAVLGSRDVSKRILQPQFVDDGPHIRNTQTMDGAFAELSRAAESSWPVVVFQLAHETVHLLNPIAGNAATIEEGVAVAFSLHVQPSCGICIFPSIQSYLLAFQLVSLLPGGPLVAGRRVRERVGALSGATAEDLGDLFPSIQVSILERLAERFTR